MKQFILGSILILATGTVMAENEQFSILDTDKDGLLSFEEAKVDTSIGAAFSELDLNQDGYLSEPELAFRVD